MSGRLAAHAPHCLSSPPADSRNPSQGTLIKAAQFLSEELPIRLSHRVVELESLPDGLSKMPSINRVKEWYAESFEVRHCTTLLTRRS